jgi:hypothetical protein
MRRRLSVLALLTAWRPPMSRVVSLLGVAGGELADAATGGDGVGVLRVVDLGVDFGAVGEFVANEEASIPTLREVAIAEVVTDVAVDADGANAGVDFERKEEVGAGSNDAAGDGAGGIVEEDLRIGGDADVGLLLGGVGGSGGVAGGCWGKGWGLMAEEAEEAGAETAFEEGVVGMVLVKAPFDAGLAFAEAADGCAGGCGG